MANQACFLLLIFLINAFSSKQEDFCGDVGDVHADTLVLSIVVFRHADRTPYKTYPNDPHQEDAWEKYGGFGQLTQTGMEQHYLFGQWMRKCYNSTFTELYNPQNVYIRCTDYDRTLQSAESHLAGVYPPKEYQIWTNTTDLANQWQPIPIHTVPKWEDYLLITDIKCPPYDALIADAWAHSPRIKEIQIKNQGLLDYIAKNAGLTVPGDLNEVTSHMTDAVHVERLYGYKLPDWLNQTVQDKLELWRDIWIIVELATDEMTRYAAGDLVRTLQEAFRNKTEKKLPQKLIYYSGHDTTVGSLLSAYGDFDRVGPPYRCAVFNELHYDKTEKRYFVKAFYRNDTNSDPVPLQIRNCGDKRTFAKCWLEDYYETLKPVTLADKRRTCYAEPSNNELDQASIIAISVTSAVVVVLIVVTVVFLLFPVFKRTAKEETVQVQS